MCLYELVSLIGLFVCLFPCLPLWFLWYFMLGSYCVQYVRCSVFVCWRVYVLMFTLYWYLLRRVRGDSWGGLVWGLFPCVCWVFGVCVFCCGVGEVLTTALGCFGIMFVGVLGVSDIRCLLCCGICQGCR